MRHDPDVGHIPEKLAATLDREPKVYQLSERVFTAYEFSTSNMTMLVGDDGVVIVDTLQSCEDAAEAMKAFRGHSDLPVKAVIYTHNHMDHIAGAMAVVDPDDVAAGRVEVIAHETLMDELARIIDLAPVMSRRGSANFGAGLERGPKGYVSSGLGINNFPGRRSFIAPTLTVGAETTLNLCGLELTLIHAPSETDDQLVVWLAGEEILISADVIQGETFPNIYPLRGSPFRNPRKWVETIDRLRRLEPVTLAPHHGRPVIGKQNVADVFIAYRDAIQYLNDQTIRRINKGHSPRDIAAELKMPDHLATHPWLGEFYGTYRHCIPSIYHGHLGWFEGDPACLDFRSTSEKARLYVEGFGGRERCIEMARGAFDSGDPLWAAQILGYLLQMDEADTDARALRAECVRDWALDQTNPLWRNWGLTHAKALERMPNEESGPIFDAGAPDVVRALPTDRLVNHLAVRLRAEACLDFEGQLTLLIDDESFTLTVRRGICEFAEADAGPDSVDRFCLSRAEFAEALIGGPTPLDLFAADDSRSIGGSKAIQHILGLFEFPRDAHS